MRLIESPERLAHEAEAIRRERVLGFDTETRPAFRKGESYPTALVQLAGEAVVWIFPLQRVDCSLASDGNLRTARLVKAGIGVADDLRQMKKLFAFEEANVVDRRRARQAPGGRADGLAQPRGTRARLPHPEGQPHLELGRRPPYAAADRLCRNGRVGSSGALSAARGVSTTRFAGTRSAKRRPHRVLELERHRVRAAAGRTLLARGVGAREVLPKGGESPRGALRRAARGSASA